MTEISIKVKDEMTQSLTKQINKLTEDKDRLENSIRVSTKIVKEINIKLSILTKFINLIGVN